MTIQIKLSGLTNLTHKVQTLGALDFTPLMVEWETVLHDDNRRGALLGLDGKGRPLEAVRYRPVDPTRRRKPIDYRVLPHNNLTSSHYRSLSGPPLAPRGADSRIVTNFETSHARLPSTRDWVAIGAWRDVLDVQGRPFLRYHFKGRGALPKRDLRGVRPDAVRAARKIAREFVVSAIRASKSP